MLICPVCKKKLKLVGKSYRCEANHTFDIAKQGYTNLYLKSSKNSGDNKEMVKARTTFLDLDFYRPLAQTLLEMIHKLKPEVIIDAGCGEGYYTNIIKTGTKSEMYAFDLSKDALKHAARKNRDVHYFLSSIFSIPMQDNSCDVLLNIFAPFADKEYSRLLKKEGYLIKVDPNVDHLKEMKDFLYENPYENEVFDLNSDVFTLIDHQEVTYTMNLQKDDIKALFQMTPYSYKTSKEVSERLYALPSLKCTASFMIYLFHNNK